jgi:hypothetical protein
VTRAGGDNATPTSAAMIISAPKNVVTGSSGSVSPRRSLLVVDNNDNR